jgi:hypothetical protein
MVHSGQGESLLPYAWCIENQTRQRTISAYLILVDYCHTTYPIHHWLPIGLLYPMLCAFDSPTHTPVFPHHSLGLFNSCQRH